MLIGCVRCCTPFRRAPAARRIGRVGHGTARCAQRGVVGADCPALCPSRVGVITARLRHRHRSVVAVLYPVTIVQGGGYHASARAPPPRCSSAAPVQRRCRDAPAGLVREAPLPDPRHRIRVGGVVGTVAKRRVAHHRGARHRTARGAGVLRDGLLPVQEHSPDRPIAAL